MMNKRFLKPLFLLMFLVTTLFLQNSCTIQNKIASQFQAHSDSVAVLILPPEQLQKSSQTIQRLYPQFSKFSPDLQDTVWAHQTKLLDLVADTIILNRYQSSLLLMLRKSGMHIYDASQIDAFKADSKPKFIFRVGQLVLEEDKQKVDFSKELDAQAELYKDMEITVLSLNVWFELYQSLEDTVPVKVLFAQKMASDIVDGQFFEAGDSQYEFRFKRADLDKDSIVKLATETGAQNAQQITDYFFTRYVRTQFPESQVYFGYDLNQKNIYYPSESLQFVEIKKP